MSRSVDSSLCLEVVREHRWSVTLLHFGQSLFAEYFDVLPGANDMAQHDMAVRISLETVEKVSRSQHFQARRSLWFLFPYRRNCEI